MCMLMGVCRSGERGRFLLSKWSIVWSSYYKAVVVAHAREVNLNGTDLEVLYGTLVLE